MDTTYVANVPVSYLVRIKPGNRLGKTNIQELKQDIAQNGFREPLQLTYSQADRTMILGEGNHRLQAARELGINAVPTTVFRTTRPINGTPVNGVEPNADDYVPGQMKPTAEMLRLRR